MLSLNRSSSLTPELDPMDSPLTELICEEHPTRNYQDTTSDSMESQETESESKQWTNEKHSSYLKSMEASFVNQLYDSLNALGGFSEQDHSSEPNNSRQMNHGVSTPSGQFKVFKDGSWVRVNLSNFKREVALPKPAKKSDPVFANPWVQRYRSSCRHQTRRSPTFQEQASISTDSNTEMTDQNFVDEDFEEKKSRKRHQKSRKISAATESSNDQVVPLANLSLIDDRSEVRHSRKQSGRG